MFERFTDEARRVVVLSQEEARLLNHDSIGTEHLLLGVVHDGDCVAAEALGALGIAVESVRDEVLRAVGHGRSVPGDHMPFTAGAKKAFELALREALSLGDDHIGTEHVLLGLLREAESVAAQVLGGLGVDLDGLRAQVATMREASRGGIVTGTRRLQRLLMARPGMIPPAVIPGREDACSFCGRDLWDVERHVTSSSTSARICGDCVEACRREINEAEAQDRPGAQALRLPPRIFGPRPADEEAIREVNEAFAMACGGARDDEERSQYIEDGSVLAPLLREAADRHQQSRGAVVQAVRFLSDDHAQVRFAIRVGGAEFPFTGDAVRLDGRWRVSRDTIGALLAAAGVSIPP